MFDLVDKVVLITGAANGIGAAAVRKFLADGAKFVAFLDLDEKNGYLLEEELTKAYGAGKSKFLKCDVTKDEELFNAYNYTIEKHGYIDVVVNNAAIGDDRIYKKQIEINVTSVVTSSLKALELMRKDKGGKGGTIINIASGAALYLQTTPTLFVYCATKSAVLMFSKSLGMEAYYTHTGVRVLTVGFHKTTTNLEFTLWGIDEICTEATRKTWKSIQTQTPEAAAEGVLEAYKKGNTASVWFINNGKIEDITESVNKAYNVMSGQMLSE